LTKTTLGGKNKPSYAYQKKSTVVPKGDAEDVKATGKDVCGAKTTSFSGQWTFESLRSGGILSKDGYHGLKGFHRHYDLCSQTPFLFNPEKKYLCVICPVRSKILPGEKHRVR
jgi:hypothetical protein